MTIGYKNIMPDILPVVMLVLLYFNLSCILMSDRESTMHRTGDVIEAVISEARLAFSGRMYMIADLYFHKGLGHKEKEGFTDEFFQELSRNLNAKGHFHLSGKQIDEIMPWLWLGTKMDPENDDIFVTAAFWLAQEGQRPDLALDLLKQARYSNPRSYKLFMQEGRIHLKLGDKTEAARAFDMGIAFWPGKTNKDSEDARYDLSELLMYRGLLYEATGNIMPAIKCFKGVLQLQPQRTDLRERIKTMEQGQQPSSLAGSLLGDTLQVWERKIRHESCEEHDHDNEHGKSGE
jgi:tetratricopeptide (TPR) repeat protein